MKLLIDARYTRTDQFDGISRYGANLIAAAARLADVRMLIHDERQLQFLPDVPWVKINSPLSPAELFVAGRINKLGADVVFCPMQTMGSFGRRYGLILTIHDLIYYRHPKPPGFLPLPVQWLWRLYHKAYWPQRMLLNRADMVATISRTTQSLLEQTRLTRRQIRIVSNAPHSPDAPRDPHAPADRELLYMGSYMPYKNVETLIVGMALLPGYRLHLLSPLPDARAAELSAAAADPGQLVFHHGVSDGEYRDLLHRATALVTLSRDEGYGLPLIEAMAAGTPVIASDIPIFREVAAGAALHVDPDDPAAFAAAVRTLEDPDRRARASKEGAQRAAEFSWDHSAAQLVAMAEEVLQRRQAGG
ncbi:group 1 glycosyl transferase [Arthrobacter crystallopoietes BAB-32]|uniref:Group 1 glycosyl transferase n=1 Tax=Arthrobacter crystallopoietes BAB-32 TaxID=1246476 RepID=N1V4F9_9MICC|nr:glycosyltransferase family 1 protein [Arthrobacter crystallopoietes]EMY33133.1 group 1 glycosyl transferase [Arthrobacter crystallopoietes BAB-32]